MSGRELVIDAGFAGRGRYSIGVLVDAHFTDADFFLTLSMLIPARDRNGLFMRKWRNPEHIPYDQVRDIVMTLRGDGSYWVKIRAGGHQRHWWSFATDMRLKLSVSEQGYEKLKKFLIGILQLSGKIQFA